MEKVQQAAAAFQSLTEAIDTTAPGGRMMMQIVGAFANLSGPCYASALAMAWMPHVKQDVSEAGRKWPWWPSYIAWPCRFSGEDIHQTGSRRSISRNPISSRVRRKAIMIALNLDGQLVETPAENYLSHVSKEQILSVLTEAVSADKVDLMRGLKKDQLVQKADEELSGLRWLPKNLTVSSQREKE